MKHQVYWNLLGLTYFNKLFLLLNRAGFLLTRRPHRAFFSDETGNGASYRQQYSSRIKRIVAAGLGLSFSVSLSSLIFRRLKPVASQDQLVIRHRGWYEISFQICYFNNILSGYFERNTMHNNVVFMVNITFLYLHSPLEFN